MPRLAVAAAALVTSGCVATQTRSLVEVRDVSEVTLAGTTTRIEAGREPTDVVLSQGAFPTEVGARARYTLHAVRNADGSLAFVWETRAPILNGDDQLVIGPEGVVEIADPSVLHPELLGAPTLKLDSCASLKGTRVRGGAFVGWRAHEWAGCDGALAVPYQLETPWSNVVRVRQTVEPYRGAAAAGIVLSTVFFGGLGALFLALPCRSTTGSDCATTLHTLGWTFVGIGGFFDLLMLPTLVWPSRETISYPR